MMWARIVECMLGCWLLMSPFIFQHSPEAEQLWINDLAVGGVLIVFSLASYWRPTAWAHLLLLPTSLWLMAFGRFGIEPPLPPARQNQIVVGLLLMMFAIVPNYVSSPPECWQTEELPEQAGSSSEKESPSIT